MGPVISIPGEASLLGWCLQGDRALCDKFKVRCAKCPNRRFAPMDDRVVLDHLQGRHVVGIYPLLLDESCWFLAADFDGEGWKNDVTAVLDTCRRFAIPAALERSRSGDPGGRIYSQSRASVVLGNFDRNNRGSWILRYFRAIRIKVNERG